jgi:glycosyltransferase involved in cell wall biosynthesis
MDVTIVINCHKEGNLLVLPLRAMSENLTGLALRGYLYEVIFVADCSDDLTLRIINNFVQQTKYSTLKQVFFNDLSLSRNFAANSANGAFISFIDGDDFWSSTFIIDCLDFHRKNQNSNNVILHPELVAELMDNDVVVWKQKKSNFRSLITLLEYNLWTSSVFAPKNIFIEFPYKTLDQTLGVGFEDWEWNENTIINGFRHLPIKNNIHFVSKKTRETLSLSQVHAKSAHRVLDTPYSLGDHCGLRLYLLLLRIINFLYKRI